jgi:LacI family transcriptional regulator
MALKVADEKREAVLNAVDKLDYQPNVFAQGLASGQSKTIGVLTPYISSPFLRRDDAGNN